jgi:hypothetical protein
MKLVEISLSGDAAQPIEQLPAIAADIGAAYVTLYAAGYVKPWLGYFALEDSVCMGTCGFKGLAIQKEAYFAEAGLKCRVWWRANQVR